MLTAKYSQTEWPSFVTPDFLTTNVADRERELTLLSPGRRLIFSVNRVAAISSTGLLLTGHLGSQAPACISDWLYFQRNRHGSAVPVPPTPWPNMPTRSDTSIFWSSRPQTEKCGQPNINSYNDCYKITAVARSSLGR